MSIQGITENDISDYLLNTPGFFERHAELLATVQLTSPHGQRAVSLQERQMEMLRERIKGLEHKIIEMIRNGQDNSAIADRLHQWTMALLLTADAAELPQVLLDDLKQRFQIPQAALRVWGVASRPCRTARGAAGQRRPEGFCLQPVAALLRRQRRLRGLGLVRRRLGRDVHGHGAAAPGWRGGRLRAAGAGLARSDALRGADGHRVPVAHRRGGQRQPVAPAGLRAVGDALSPELQRYIEHVRVERRLAPRSVQMIHDALLRLQQSAVAAQVDLREVQTQHVRRWAAQLRERPLAPRSIAIHLSAWRGLYRWWGRNGQVAINPVEGVRAPKAPKPLPKALSVEQAVSLASFEPTSGNPVLRARDHCMVELLYGSGLRVAELVGLDLRGGDTAAGWIDAADASAQVLGKGRKRRSGAGGPCGAGRAARLAGAARADRRAR